MLQLSAVGLRAVSLEQGAHIPGPSGVETATWHHWSSEHFKGKTRAEGDFPKPQASELTSPVKPAEPSLPCHLAPLLGPTALGVHSTGLCG